MENKKEIAYHVLAALENLNMVFDHINEAIALCNDNSYLCDTLNVAVRNLYMSRMKLEVAGDLTESFI